MKKAKRGRPNKQIENKLLMPINQIGENNECIKQLKASSS